MPDKLGLQPYVVHATFQFSGTPGKRHRMRERLWWNVRLCFARQRGAAAMRADAGVRLPRLQDPPEYFNHEKGFIAYDDTVPPELLEAARQAERNFTLDATMPHFNLVNHQLRQLRAAFALAQVRPWLVGRSGHSLKFTYH
jgi:hypothetical protein